MATFNVLAGVCELITADSPNEAIGELHKRLEQAGFTTYRGSGSELPDVFESEDGPNGPGYPT